MLFYVVQILYFLSRESQTFLLVVGFEVADILYGCRLDVDVEDVLVQAVIHTLQHGVVVGILRAHGEVLFDARDAPDVHVLGYFHGIGTPRSDHLAARTNEPSRKLLSFEKVGIAIQPA